MVKPKPNREMQSGIKKYKQAQGSSVLNQFVNPSQFSQWCDGQGQAQEHQGPGASGSGDELNRIGCQIVLVTQDHQSDQWQ